METFKQIAAEIKRETDQIDIIKSKDWYYQFAVFSTNLGLLLPDIPVRRHIPLFRQTLLNQRLVNLEAHYIHQLDIAWQAEQALDFSALRTNPAMVCTYHTGSYRLLGYLLMQQGISIAMVLSTEALQNQGKEILKIAQAIGRKSGATCTLIDAQHPMSGMHILRASNQKRTVVAYLDGNMGVLSNAHNANLHTVKFLHATMRVRTGLARLAQRAQTRIYSVMATRNVAMDVIMCCNRVLTPDSTDKDDEFPKAATAKLYSDLADLLKRQPWVWENWFYLQENLD